MGRYDQYSDEELIVRLREGETEISDYLMEKYKEFVRKKARAMFLIGGETDDLIQEGMIGLFKAIQNYQADKETSFRTFASLCIDRQLYSAVQNSNRQKHQPLNSYVSLNRPLYEEEYEMTLLDVLGENEKVVNPEEIMINREQYEDTERKLSKLLSDFEKKVLNYYLEGKSYQEIGEILKRDSKSIDNALQRIKRKIEKMR